MGSIISQRFRSAAFAFVCLLPMFGRLAMPLQADDVTISLDTSSLTAGGYFLDYQIAGTDAVLGQNTVAINNIQLGGGTFSNETLSGGASGTFNNYSIVDTDVFNEALVGFQLGSEVKFGLSFTDNFSGGGTPDSFTFALLDSNFNSIVSSGLGASVLINLDGGRPVVQLFAADQAFNSVTPIIVLPVSQVPEPAGWLLVLTLVVIICSSAWASRTLTARARQWLYSPVEC